MFGPADAFTVLFDRGGILRRGPAPAMDIGEQGQRLLTRRWRWVLVEKQLQRGHPLEALT
ncbi:hypothetical protein [Deinococcus sp.]|uniref:hypothetical protein n=1 Tax=Deinococcus sp. TaxID=47478 RepID=UPI002869C9A5|nr:hypothetical protein [Deinococcus sp.]